jgi:copper chaperone CopZ
MPAKHAVREVFTALTAVPGIARAEVTLGAAVVAHDGRATREVLAAALGAAGYTIAGCSEERHPLPLLEEVPPGAGEDSEK